MKKRNLKGLKLNKASISNLQFVYGGYEEQQNNDGPADGPAPLFSIGYECSKRNTCDRVCRRSTVGAKPDAR